MKEQPQNAPIVEVQKEQSVNEPPNQVAVPQNEDTAKADLLALLSPPPLPEAITNADPKALAKAEETLKGFGYSFPIRGMLESYKALHATQQTTAAILAEVALKSVKAEGFVTQVIKEQEQQAKVLAERKRTEQEFIATHPEYAQQPQQQQASPMGGLNLQTIAPLIQGLLGGQTAAPVSNPLMEKFNEYVIKKMDSELTNLMNPAPSMAERVGEALINEIVAKNAAKFVKGA